MYQLIMADTIACMFLSIQLHLFDQIGIISGTYCRNNQFFFFVILRVKPNSHFVESRCSQHIIGHSRTVRIKTYHTENGPCRHSSGVIITGNTIRLVSEIFSKQPFHLFLSTPLFSLEVAEQIRIAISGSLAGSYSPSSKTFCNLSTNFFLPPIRRVKPAMSWGT